MCHFIEHLVRSEQLKSLLCIVVEFGGLTQLEKAFRIDFVQFGPLELNFRPTKAHWSLKNVGPDVFDGGMV